MICQAVPKHTEHTAPLAALQAGWGLNGGGWQAGLVQGTCVFERVRSFWQAPEEDSRVFWSKP